ncbi:MAG: TIGR04283 family arsenosugar biosynthesis glycosyltransferase [Geobacteraceae bacterium]
MDIIEPAVELSIIVPVLNEAEVIGTFLRGLALQQGVSFQVVLCDGGSTDDTTQRVSQLLSELPFALKMVHTEKGRARQMNAGVREANGEYYLFLHADSAFPDPDALRQGLSFLRQTVQSTGEERVAARFSLRFQDCDGSMSFHYYSAAGKARLDRTGCTHGDQGFFLSRRFFASAGPFDQSCMVMEDTRFAEKVRAQGSWLLLPVELVTSARRFETEGAAVRQVLNMILMTLDAVGREDIIRDLPGIYAAQSMTGRLCLLPFLDRIRLQIKGLPFVTRMKFWYSVGHFVCLNAWQIPCFLDMRRNYRRRVPVGEGEMFYLETFGRTCEPLFKTGPLAVFAAGLTFLSFHVALLLVRLRGW